MMAPRDTFNGVGFGRKAGSETEEAIRRGQLFSASPRGLLLRLLRPISQADGLDGGRLSDRSGAESNVTAGLALALDPDVLALARGWSWSMAEAGVPSVSRYG